MLYRYILKCIEETYLQINLKHHGNASSLKEMSLKHQVYPLCIHPLIESITYCYSACIIFDFGCFDDQAIHVRSAFGSHC